MKKNNTNKQILDLAKELITICSTAANPKAMKKALTICKKTVGSGFEIEEFEKNGIPSLLVRNTKKRPERFKIILNAHLDVVPATDKEFKPFVKNGKLHGRGSYDMKAATAAMIYLYKNLAKKVNYPLGLQLTTDEELGGDNGTKYQIKKGVRADFVITGEGTNLRAIHQSKGMIKIKLVAEGRSSHSAYPWLGENAIIKLQNVIAELINHFPHPETETHGTTVTVTHITTLNHQHHTVTPDYCEAILDIRFAHEDSSTILSRIQSIIGDRVSHEITHSSHIHTTDIDNRYIKLLEQASHHTAREKMILANAHGTSDVRHFTEAGCDGVEFGPIGGSHHHSDEWVDMKSLKKYYKILEKFLLTIS